MSLIRKTNQRTMLDLWESVDKFKADLNGIYSPLKPSDISDTTIATTYFMLIGRYGDSPILGYVDEPRWKMRFFTCYREYTPEWEVKDSLQKEVRGMSLDDISEGRLSIFNTALNPNTEPKDTDLKELTYINSQNTTRQQLNRLDALMKKWEALDSSIDENYLNHFSKLFSKFATADNPLYIYGGNEE